MWILKSKRRILRWLLKIHLALKKKEKTLFSNRKYIFLYL